MTDLPSHLQKYIETLIENHDRQTVTQARSDLSDRYQQRTSGTYMKHADHALSYLATRMPATYAVCRQVLSNLTEHSAQKPRSLLDLGSGPGTAYWAAHQIFPQLEQVTFVEKNPTLIQYAKAFIHDSPEDLATAFEFFPYDITAQNVYAPHDLVMCSYALNEIKRESIPMLLDAAWQSTNHFFILIEPGTPFGFERIRFAREYLIQQGAYCVAPCPHDHACPMAKDDWCHFSTRLERSQIHKSIKQGSIGYEDEKFSYVILSKRPLKEKYERILKKPLKRSGHIVFDLCNEKGYERKTISQKEKQIYKQVKKKKWGQMIAPQQVKN